MKNWLEAVPLPRRLTFAALGTAGISLVVGLFGALFRIAALPVGAAPENSPFGRVANALTTHALDYHGALMIFGFVMSAIMLERSVALRMRVARITPVLGILGALALIITGRPALAGAAFTAAALTLGAGYVLLYRRSPMTALLIEATGAIAFIGAAGIFMFSGDTARAVPLIFIAVTATIIGERVELSRVGRSLLPATSPAAQPSEDSPDAELKILWLTITALVAALVASLAMPGSTTTAIASALCSVVLCAIANATLKIDICRFTVRSTGLARYSATAMLLGYLWLIFGAVSWLLFSAAGLFSPTVMPALWDATVHCLCVGFVMSMIFGHAPIIVHGVIGKRFPYHPALYLPLIASTLALAARVLAGWFSFGGTAWVITCVAGVLAILLFMLLAVGFVSGAVKPSPSKISSTAGAHKMAANPEKC